MVVMSKQYEKLTIDKIDSVNCTSKEKRELISLFERVVRKVAGLQAKKVYFDLADFACTKESTLKEFKLIIVRNIKNSDEIYSGLFEHHAKTLSLNGTFKGKK